MDVTVVCLAAKTLEQVGIIKTKKRVQRKNKRRKPEKRDTVGGMDICVCCEGEVSATDRSFI
jgi:hypothetical protein